MADASNNKPNVSGIAPQEQQKKENWSEWSTRQYNEKYESWVPWIEDKYLKWFTKDNKASYATKDTLSKTKVTGNKQVDTLQDGVNNLVAGQVGQGGLGESVGNAVSKEGVNRAERGGRDDKGRTAPGPLGNVTDPIADNAKKGGEAVQSAAKGAGAWVGGAWGGKK